MTIGWESETPGLSYIWPDKFPQHIRRNLIATDFDEIIERRESSSLKWERYRGRDIIPLWVADMDFRSPPPIIDALRHRSDHGVFGYTLPPPGLADAVGEQLRNDYDWSIDPEWIVWLPGLVPGLNLACHAVGDDGDEVLSAVPVYPPFLSAPRNSRRNLVTTHLVDDGHRWVFDLADMERAISSRTRLLLFCNPHNPVGRAFNREELHRVAELCERHRLFICSDEIHAGLILDTDKKHIPIATLSSEIASRTITLLAPSKTFNIPGLGCALAVIPDPGLRGRFLRAMDGIVPHVNALGFAAALAAYRDCGAWHRELLDYLRGNRDLVEKAISGMEGLSMHHVEATYLAWIDTRTSGIKDPTAFFEQAGVGLSRGDDFNGPGFVRLNFGCPRPLLRKALDRMAEAIDGKLS
ncbi:MAG: PatB family C-S lyase [Geobacteraceae bacterium]|nr:PatB family C-S lyase [Geobacteraceae bacterium]